MVNIDIILCYSRTVYILFGFFILNGTGRAVNVLIESVTCRKISGIKELEDTPLERGQVVLRGENIGGE